MGGIWQAEVRAGQTGVVLIPTASQHGMQPTASLRSRRLMPTLGGFLKTGETQTPNNPLAEISMKRELQDVWCLQAKSQTTH